MVPRINYSGFVIAGIGFFLTRFTVTLAIYEAPVRFYLGGIVPLVLGLGLAAFGVALVVADIEAALVRTTAVWCLVGVATMLVLVFLTLLASTPGGTVDLGGLRSQTYLSNFLIGGSVGGTLTGVYAAHNRRQRMQLRQQANRLEVLNRMLRHEVLNAVTVIKGYASLGPDRDADAWTVVEERSKAIEEVIDEVRFLSRGPDQTAGGTMAIDLADQLAASVERARSTHSDATVAVDAPPDGVPVAADDHLERVFVHLLAVAIANAAGAKPTVRVSVNTSADRAQVRIRYDGQPLSQAQRALLERGEIAEYDDPRSGFSLNVVRLLVETYRGTIDTEHTGDAETITVTLPQASNKGDRPRSDFVLPGLVPALPELVVTLAAALLAGVAYGTASELLGGSIAGIGVFYGTASPVVGWITHEFHSIVFGFVFLGLVTNGPAWIRERLLGYLVVGIIWALALWLFAASVVAPVWLQLLGHPASVPSLRFDLFVAHMAWGVALALLVAVGQSHVLPRLVGRWNRELEEPEGARSA